MAARVDSLESQLRNVEALSNVTAQGLERTRYDDSGFCLAGRFEHGWRKAWRSGGGCQEEARGRWGCLGGAAESPVRCNRLRFSTWLCSSCRSKDSLLKCGRVWRASGWRMWWNPHRSKIPRGRSTWAGMSASQMFRSPAMLQAVGKKDGAYPSPGTARVLSPR